MRLTLHHDEPGRRRSTAGSVLIIVLWVSIAIVSIGLYFANSMNYEYRAADNRVAGLTANQAIEGAARYLGYVLANDATNGVMPNNTQFKCENVPVGDAHFWVIGRDPNNSSPSVPVFGLIDEGAKLNLNSISTNVFQYLPNLTSDFGDAIKDWRGTNGAVSPDYATLGYQDKNSPFETVDELRLVYGANLQTLAGDDLNRNGALDANEKDTQGTGQLQYGLLEYTTVYTREPNFHADGSSLTNVNTASQSKIQQLLQSAGVNNASSLSKTIYARVHPPRGPGTTFKGLFDFCLFCKNQGMSSADFAAISSNVSTTTNTYLRSRINFNNANPDVLIALFMGLNVDESTAQSAAQTLVEYRTQNSSNLTSVAWVVDALGNNSSVVTALARGDWVTTRSYQFTADIAATGAYGRGYRRVKFVFDVSDGTPKILYRQDLSRLGWALGPKALENPNLLAEKSP